MPTNTTGTTARSPEQQQVAYLRKRILFSDGVGTFVVGILPTNAIILKALSGVQVEVVFNAATTNTIDVGTVASGAFYSSAGALGTVAFVPNNVAAARQDITVDTTITATVAMTGTAATTGIADVFIAYLARP